MASVSQASPRSLRALDWLNFFLADIQTGVGPFVAAALASRKWNPEQIGAVLTAGGFVSILLQTPAGAAVDAVRRKRALMAAAVGIVVTASRTLAFGTSLPVVLSGQLLLGVVGPFIGPAVTAITLGLVGKQIFDARVGRNHGFDSAGNVCAALLLGWVGFQFEKH